MKSVLLKPALDFFPFNMASPPFSESQKKDLIKGLQFAGVTQYQLLQLIQRLVAGIVILVVLLMFNKELGYFLGHILDGSAFRP